MQYYLCEDQISFGHGSRPVISNKCRKVVDTFFREKTIYLRSYIAKHLNHSISKLILEELYHMYKTLLLADQWASPQYVLVSAQNVD